MSDLLQQIRAKAVFMRDEWGEWVDCVKREDLEKVLEGKRLVNAAQFASAMALLQAATAFINAHPADPDITKEQTEAWLAYQEARRTWLKAMASPWCQTCGHFVCECGGERE